MSKSVISPLLHVTPFVGKAKPHKLYESKPWLWCDEYGFSFCVGEIDLAFRPLIDGECVRMEIGKDPGRGWVEYPVEGLCRISALAERMAGQLFGYDVGTNEFDQAVLEHHMLTEDGVIDSDVVDTYECGTSDLPGVIFYRVVRV